LGKGWFGKVVEGEGFLEGPGATPVVVKILREDAPEEDRCLFMREVGALRALSHPNLLKVLGCSYDNEPLLVIMEFCPMVNFYSAKKYFVQVIHFLTGRFEVVFDKSAK
jgi:serine/threonine protein kinase